MFNSISKETLKKLLALKKEFEKKSAARKVLMQFFKKILPENAANETMNWSFEFKNSDLIVNMGDKIVANEIFLQRGAIKERLTASGIFIERLIIR